MKSRVEKELAAKLGSRLEIASLNIHPFNELSLSGVRLYDRSGSECLKVENLGAGIHLWRLLSERKIEITYAEIIGLDLRVRQNQEGEPLNIQFVIDAFKPKDKNKPPTKFDLNLRNVVLRRCAASFDREWLPRNEDKLKTDFNHVQVYDLKADIQLPRLSNDQYQVDLRRLAFKMSGGLTVETIALKADITRNGLTVKDLVVKLPGTELRPSAVTLRYDGFNDIVNAAKRERHHLLMTDNQITVADFSWLLPDLERYQQPLSLSLDAEGDLNDVKVNSFIIDSGNGDLEINLFGDVSSLGNKEHMNVNLEDLRLKVSATSIVEILNRLPGVSKKRRIFCSIAAIWS